MVERMRQLPIKTVAAVLCASCLQPVVNFRVKCWDDAEHLALVGVHDGILLPVVESVVILGNHQLVHLADDGLDGFKLLGGMSVGEAAGVADPVVVEGLVQMDGRRPCHQHPDEE